MKARISTLSAAAAVAAAVAPAPHAGAEISKVETMMNEQLKGVRDLSLEDQQRERELMHFTVIFEECVGKLLSVCQDIIEAEVAANPAIFEPHTTLDYEVSQVRSAADSQYYMVGLRTNMAETGVSGILGDGMVWYPFEWCIAENDCRTIGPWDCDVGTPLTVDQCCNMIKATVPNADVNGNFLDCYADYPVGSPSNPTDYGRVLIHVNDENVVVHPPRNE